MLNEEKVKLMAEIALYEKQQHEQLKRAGNYFRQDYISSHLLKSFIIYTIGFVCIMGTAFLYQAEEILTNLNLEEWDELLKPWGIAYLIGLLGYLFFVHRTYKIRYNRAARVMRLYIAKLKRLERRYEFQEKSKELAKGGTRT
ncbi:MAG: hypothetical protein Q4E24_02530 [bacterium]|nr:hypothetical protein [bacterium]